MTNNPPYVKLPLKLWAKTKHQKQVVFLNTLFYSFALSVTFCVDKSMIYSNLQAQCFLVFYLVVLVLRLQYYEKKQWNYKKVYFFSHMPVYTVPASSVSTWNIPSPRWWHTAHKDWPWREYLCKNKVRKWPHPPLSTPSIVLDICGPRTKCPRCWKP